MGLFTSHEFNNLEELFVFELNDLFDAEQRICDSLPKMIDAASSPLLKDALRSHLEQTKQQIHRLEQVFMRLGRETDGVTCEGIKGILSEGAVVCDAKAPGEVKDAALIGAAQRVEHYEMAGYGTVRTFAHRLGMHDIADLLQVTLDEEGNTDKQLTQIAEQSVNVQAQHT